MENEIIRDKRLNTISTTKTLFNESLAKVPEDLRMEISWSFAISDKIVEALESKGMTQKMLAKKMGKSETEVSRWLSGTHNFTLRTLSKISKVLDVNLIEVSL